MRRLRFHRFGAPAEVLAVEESEPPPLSEGEVRLRVLASPINPVDLNFIAGTYGVKPELPATAGIEACGEVVESGHADFAVGDRCIFLRRAELWATEVVIGGGSLFKLPEEIDPLQACLLKVNPATAWRLLKGFTSLPEGAWVIQNAANSGVGRAVIQLARSMGLRTVNLVRRESLVPELEEIGADAVLLDDGDAVDRVKALCGDERPPLALNAVGGDSALRLMNALAPGGVHATYGAMGLKPLKVPNGMLIFKGLRIEGLWITRWLDEAPREKVRSTYQRLGAEMAAGNLKVPVDSVHALEDFEAALERVEAADRHGKVLFTPNGPCG